MNVTPADRSPRQFATTRRDGTVARPRVLALGALGVVYGDLGTNPLFALRECFASNHPLALVPANVIGSVSLALWALIAVICIKYTVFILRADNEGEGGTLALLGKIPPTCARWRRDRPIVLVMVLLFGSALLLGDGIVTPAISVLSAVEGLGVDQERVVIVHRGHPGRAVRGAALRHGARRRGVRTGDARCGSRRSRCSAIVQIVRSPRSSRALDPRYAIAVLRAASRGATSCSNAIILVVAGGEALYADLGHFGRRPIVRAWYWIVLPALALTYAGQGALLLRDPARDREPVLRDGADALRYPLVVLATAATVIASQALISGAFSLARQARQPRLLAALTIDHTSNEETGQIYVPIVNTLLMIGCVALVIGFGSSARSPARTDWRSTAR